MRSIGIILAGGDNSRMRELSNQRAVCAMPVAGSYRAIDFALSSMTNSGIMKVAVLTQYNARSLNEHLSSSKWWNFGRKQGGLYLFPPTVTKTINTWYRGTADAIWQNLDWLEQCHEPYVVIASGDGIYKLDFQRVLEYHIDKRADVTVVCTDYQQSDVERFGVLDMDADGRIREFEEKPSVASSSLVSTGIYVVRRRQLIEMLKNCAKEERADFVRDILIRYRSIKRIFGYKMEAYWSNISSVESYYRTNMDFLRPEVRGYFFREYPYVLSRKDDNPPARFLGGSSVKNSLVSTGCVISGTVENSVIFKNVVVEEGCVIRNAVILGDVFVGAGSQLENCVVESRATLPRGSFLKGETGIKVVTGEKGLTRYTL